MAAPKLYMLVLGSLLLLLCGCGGTSGTSALPVDPVAPDGTTPDLSDPFPAPPATTGTVVLLLRDNPLAALDAFYLTIESVELLGGSAGPFLLFDGEERVNLLDFQTQEFLLAMRDDVPPGTYDKIRLHISDPAVEPNPDNDPVILTGNGKLDLNPQGSFEVVAGEFLAIRVDVDAPRSVHVVGTGSQRFIVRPLVFVEIETHFDPIPLGDLEGIVTAVDLSQDEITLEVPDRANDVCVRVDGQTAIFAEDMAIAELDVFAVGDHAMARGRLDSTGTLVTELVFQGDPMRLRGTMPDGTLDPPFPFLTDSGEAVQDTLSTEIAAGARAYREQGSEIPIPILAGNSRARLTGQRIGSAPDYRVGLVDVEVERLAGTLESIDLTASPVEFVFRNVIEELTPMILADDADISLIGDGAVPLEFLTVGLSIVVTISEGESGELIATAMSIAPIEFSGEITRVDVHGNTAVISSAGVETTLWIRGDATFLMRTDLVTTEIGLADVAVGDTVEGFGLELAGVPFLWVLVIDLHDVTGVIDSVSASPDPVSIVIRDPHDRLFTVGVPVTAFLTLTGGGDLVPDLVTSGLSVSAQLTGLTGTLKVSAMTVDPVTLSGLVVGTDLALSELTLMSGTTFTTLDIRTDASIFFRTDGVSTLIDLDSVAVGDSVEVSGLPEPTGGFLVYTLWVTVLLTP